MRTRLAMFVRLLAIQGAWNYETLLGNGIGFCVEPALRLLPGARTAPAYRAALARQSQYFNAHPYLAAVAVGALARAELEASRRRKIERFRTALCGPLGSVGDRLVWAAWLPACSLAALAAFGFGVRHGWRAARVPRHLQRRAPRVARLGTQRRVGSRDARRVGAWRSGAATRAAAHRAGRRAHWRRRAAARARSGDRPRTRAVRRRARRASHLAGSSSPGCTAARKGGRSLSCCSRCSSSTRWLADG